MEYLAGAHYCSEPMFVPLPSDLRHQGLNGDVKSVLPECLPIDKMLLGHPLRNTLVTWPQARHVPTHLKRKPVEPPTNHAVCCKGKSQVQPKVPVQSQPAHIVESMEDNVSVEGLQAGGKQLDGPRWWTSAAYPQLCPLTNFPIMLLPYPPFKFRINAKHSTPHVLVDGKLLAMNVIDTGRWVACGRHLHASDIKALDVYMHRCKLGPFRPGRALALLREAAASETPEQRTKAVQELKRFKANASAELARVRSIQEKRLLHLTKEMHMHGVTRPALVKHP